MYIIPDCCPLAAMHPEAGVFPWWVELTLGSFSKKHVFMTGRPISLHRVHAELENLEARICWRWHFSKDGSSSARPPKRMERRPPAKFQGRIPGALRVYLDAIRNNVWKEVSRANSQIKARRAAFQPPRYLKATLAWLRRNKWEVAPTDKDGVFAICRPAVLDRMLASQLNTRKYLEIHQSRYEMERKGARTCFFRLAQRMHDSGFPAWAREARRTLQNKQKSFRANLSWTVKTHTKCLVIFQCDAYIQGQVILHLCFLASWMLTTVGYSGRFHIYADPLKRF